MNFNSNTNKKPKRLETSQLLRRTWQVNQIFELILEQCVANYYRDNTIAKWFLNFPRLIFFFIGPHVTTLQKLSNEHYYKNKPAVMAGSYAAIYKILFQNSIFVLILDEGWSFYRHIYFLEAWNKQEGPVQSWT